MKYTETGFTIDVVDNSLIFTGALEKSSYADVDAFLRKADQALAETTCVIDLQTLVFLNSSGIRSLATFILGSPKSFEIRINSEVTWQTESIPALQHLKSKGITIVPS